MVGLPTRPQLVSRRVKRNRLLWLLALLLIALLALSRMGGKGGAHPGSTPTSGADPPCHGPAPVTHMNRDSPDWRGTVSR